jgi:asparagine synthase (glutamine-hydrolysing)
MCGIAGLWLHSSAPLETARQWVKGMLACMVHRGPDHEGMWDARSHGLVLGSRRLSIIDLSPSGHQPMVTEDEQLAVVYNGEIYNFLELKKELEAEGAVFRSRSDTEVLLKGFERWGEGVLDRLVGMYAFGLWDARNEMLLLARDRTGEKPLYYAATPSYFAFASELQALKHIPTIDTAIDREAVALYLAYQYIPSPYSVFRGIRKLPPGHFMILRRGKIEIRRYWDPVPRALGPCMKISELEALIQLEVLLREAVHRQMISDVSLGAFLSGGIDSTTIVSLMAELSSKPVKTFTIGFEVPEYDEAPYAQVVARHLGTDHTEEYLTERDALDLIPRVPGMYGEPFADYSALPTHLVASIARKYVKVSLSGDGGDESFGGYARYRRLEYFYPLAFSLRPVSRPLKAVLARFPGKLYQRACLLGKSPREIYRIVVGAFSPEEVKSLTGLQLPLTDYDRAWEQGSPLPLRRRAMLSDMLAYLPEDLLVKVDRAAMAVSLETRAPFLDHKVIEFALQLPLCYVKDKYLLKKLACKRVPQSLINRPKQGFGVPLGRWFRSELKIPLTEAITPQRMSNLGIHNFSLILNLMNEHISGWRDHTLRLWALFVLSLWGDTR